MKLLAVIAEYNPFHKGHQWHIEHSKSMTGATHTMALMSGSIVQRGTFALTDKWTRARSAVLGGVDLICELPYVYAGQSAEYFASGAVKILNACGCCQWLSFGSESGDLKTLEPIARILSEESADFKESLRFFLDQGLPFPRARTAAVSQMTDLPVQTQMNAPNNILGIEYLKALNKTQSSILPLTFKRKGSGYHESVPRADRYASATALRHLLNQNNRKPNSEEMQLLKEQLPYSPKVLLQALENHAYAENESLFKALLHLLITTPLETLRKLPYFEPGLEFRLKSLPEHVSDLEGLYLALMTKHLPKSRIQRLLMSLITGFTDDALQSFASPDFIPYLRVLAFNEKGQSILKAIRQNGTLPIITNVKSNQTLLDEEQRNCLNWDIRTTDLFSLYCDKNYTHHRDYLNPPVRVI